MIPRGAVVATHNRPMELLRCVEALAPQVDVIVVVDNASDPPVESPRRIPSGSVRHVDIDTTRVQVLRDLEQPPNLSRLWNLGLDWLADYFAGGDVEGYDVAVVNDDATVPAGWFDALSAAMHDIGADAASHDPFGRVPPGQSMLIPRSSEMSVLNRLAGWAFVLRGEWDGARFDETFRWWCGDDDISYRARGKGFVLVGGLHVPNEHANQSTTGVLAEQTALDMQAFVDKHGRRPW
jgi:hypothetical protein